MSMLPKNYNFEVRFSGGVAFTDISADGCKRPSFL